MQLSAEGQIKYNDKVTPLCKYSNYGIEVARAGKGPAVTYSDNECLPLEMMEETSRLPLNGRTHGIQLRRGKLRPELSASQATRSFRQRRTTNTTKHTIANSSPLPAPAAALPRTPPTPTLRKCWAASPGIRRWGWGWVSGESVRAHDVLGQLLVVLLIRPV